MNEFFILLPDRRIFTLAGLEEKLKSILAHFVKFIVFDVIEVRFFEIF